MLHAIEMQISLKNKEWFCVYECVWRVCLCVSVCVSLYVHAAGQQWERRGANWTSFLGEKRL